MQLILIQGTDAEKELKKLVEFASKEENRFDPLTKAPNTQEKISVGEAPFTRVIKASSVFPGTPEFSFTVTFTNTVGVAEEPDGTVKKVLLRHASIGLQDGIPDPLAVFTICKTLGFEGTFDQWEITGHPELHDVVVIFQPMSDL